MTVEMDEFVRVEAEFSRLRETWNAKTANERAAAPRSYFTTDNRDVAKAAEAFAREAASRHHIEECAVVYLVLGSTGHWGIDSPTNDGYPLEGYDAGPLNSECEHDDGLKEECAALCRAAAYLPLPTMAELRAWRIDHVVHVRFAEDGTSPSTKLE